MILRLLWLALLCSNALAESGDFKNLNGKKISYTAAVHYSYTDMSRFYEINSAGKKNDTRSFQPGIEFSLLYPLASLGEKLSKFYIEPNYTVFSEHEADIQTLCNNQLCYKKNSMKHQALMLNFHWQAYSNEKTRVNLFLGPAYYWFEGELVGEKWSDEANGYQLGFKTYITTTRKLQPFFGLRLSDYELKVLDRKSSEKETSFILGLHF